MRAQLLLAHGRAARGGWGGVEQRDSSSESGVGRLGTLYDDLNPSQDFLTSLHDTLTGASHCAEIEFF